MGGLAAAGTDRRGRRRTWIAAGHDPRDGLHHHAMSSQMAGQMQIGPDLLLLLPQLGTVATAVLALVAEMLRRPVWGRWITLVGLLVAAVLALPLIGRAETVFSGTFRVDELSTWAALTVLPA